MSEVERLSVRIPLETMEKLQQLMKTGRYQNISEIVKLALDEYIEKNPVDVDDMKSNEIELELLMKDDEPPAFDKVIEDAVKDYVKTHIN